MDQEKINKQIFERIGRLENAVFNEQKTVKLLPKEDKNFHGATGGLRLLISKGFFNSKKTFAEIKKELASQDYHYSDQAIQTPLNNLSKSGGPLVGFREGGKKVYAKRK